MATQPRDPNASVLLVGFRVFGARRGWSQQDASTGSCPGPPHNGQRAIRRASRSSARQGGWLCCESPALPPELQSGAVPLERERWICRGCSRMWKVFSSLAIPSVWPAQGAGGFQEVGRTMQLSSEDRTHLKWLWTSPTKLVKEESFLRNQVPQADARYLVDTQVRRTKSALMCPAPPAGTGVDCAMHPVLPHGDEEHGDSPCCSTQGQRAGLVHAPSGLAGR